ncbi:LysR family transcriptional regulator [Oceanospirillum beijerinckii]|uniref:LysR family transcriptional regulator n=1 Tax=Oceanospirillum beijerinckii TaxID=64976 RepID=UPI000418AC30|nr:LysR family transcriptional regulator [Oceanospirillum beijerinckii]
MPDNISLTAIRTLAIVAREQSFTKAAEQLCISPSAVSHQMKQLEQQLGYRLFHRKAQGVALTPSGLELARYANQAMQQLDTGLLKARESSQKTQLTLAVTPSLAQLWLIPRLNDFCPQYPNIELMIKAQDKLTDFNQQHADLHLHFGDGQAIGLKSLYLMSESVVAVGHKTLFSDLINPEDPNEVQALLSQGQLRLLHYKGGEEDAPGGLNWREWFSRQNITMASHQAHLYFSHLQLVLEAVKQQQGIALMWQSLLPDELRLSHPAQSRHIKRAVHPGQVNHLTQSKALGQSDNSKQQGNSQLTVLPFAPITLKYSHYLVAPEHHWQREEIQALSGWLQLQAS